MIVWKGPGRLNKRSFILGHAYTCLLNSRLVYFLFLEARFPAAFLRPRRELGAVTSRDDSRLSSHVAQPARCHAGETERSYSATYALLGGDSEGLTSSGGKFTFRKMNRFHTNTRVFPKF